MFNAKQFYGSFHKISSVLSTFAGGTSFQLHAVVHATLIGTLDERSFPASHQLHTIRLSERDSLKFMIFNFNPAQVTWVDPNPPPFFL